MLVVRKEFAMGGGVEGVVVVFLLLETGRFAGRLVGRRCRRP